MLTKLVATRARMGLSALLNRINAPPGSGYPLMPLEMVRSLASVLARLSTKMPLSRMSAPLKSVQKYSTYEPLPKLGLNPPLPVMRPAFSSTLMDALSCRGIGQIGEILQDQGARAPRKGELEEGRVHGRCHLGLDTRVECDAEMPRLRRDGSIGEVTIQGPLLFG